MFEDFFKRMAKGFGATMFLISLPVVMLVVGLLCYTILEMFGFNYYATLFWKCSALMLMPSGCRAALRL